GVADVLRHFGFDDPGGHRVDGNLPWRELDGECAGEGVDGAFARGVIGLAAATFLTRHRAQVDDLARALDDHVRHYGARHVEDAADVRLEHRAYVVVLERRELIVADDARVVHQDVDAAATIGHALHCNGARARIAHVDLFG